ncbi:MAG: spore coat protein U domain-containing protein [Betaproteobacteria bacterium]
MKKLVLAAIVGITAFLSSSAQAQTVSTTFNVNINLTTACTLTAVAPVDFAYTSFQVAAATATGGTFSVSCTNGRPYTLGLQAGNGAAVPPGAASLNITDDAVNLAYTLNLSAAGATGTGVAQPFSVTGTMAGGQSGTCVAGGVCNNIATGSTNYIQTLIVNF